MRLRVIISLVTLLCLAVGTARGSSIGVFFRSDASDSDICVPQNTGFTVYVIAILGGDPASAGMTGAEYRLTGFDPGWFANVTPGPGANVAIGSPIDGVGTNVAWPSCQAPGNSLVLLHTISVFSTLPPAPHTLRIERRNPPTNPNWACPLLVLCDEPTYTKLCVPGGQALVDHPFLCTIAVEPATWSGVKALYMN